MGLGTNRGYSQYNDPFSSVNLRSLSGKRAYVIKQHRLYPNDGLLYERAQAKVDKSYDKLRAYNGKIYSLKMRIGNEASTSARIHLAARITRLSNLKEELAAFRIPAQEKLRNAIAQARYEWANLPLLDGEIADGRNRRPR